MSGDWRGTLWILLVTFCIVIIGCTETFWSPYRCHMVNVNIAEEWIVSARDKTDNKKLFCFSFARLMEAGGATLRDGTHELYIYKCEDRARLESSSYLQLPSSARDTSVQISSTSSSAGTFNRTSKESVYIHTLLCSTKLTQNGKPFVHQLFALYSATSWYWLFVSIIYSTCMENVLC
jgi:hypothetical protein